MSTLVCNLQMFRLMEVLDDLLISLFDDWGLVDLDGFVFVYLMFAHLPHANYVIHVRRPFINTLTQFAIH